VKAPPQRTPTAGRRDHGIDLSVRDKQCVIMAINLFWLSVMRAKHGSLLTLWQRDAAKRLPSCKLDIVVEKTVRAAA